MFFVMILSLSANSQWLITGAFNLQVVLSRPPFFVLMKSHLWKSEYEVKEEPNLVTWMQGGLDYIMLQYLNIDGIRTIGSVLGQSIALDYYVRQVSIMKYMLYIKFLLE